MYGKQPIKSAHKRQPAEDKQNQNQKATLKEALKEPNPKKILGIVRGCTTDVLKEVIHEMSREEREEFSALIKQQAEMDKQPQMLAQLQSWQDLMPFIMLSHEQRKGSEYAEYRTQVEQGGISEEALDGIKNMIESIKACQDLDKILSPLFDEASASPQLQ